MVCLAFSIHLGRMGRVINKWRQEWVNLVGEYVELAAGPEARERLFANELQVFLWAGVHSGCSYHPCEYNPLGEYNPFGE